MVPLSVAYLRVRAIGMFMGRTREISNQICIAEKDVITPFLSTVVATVVNVIGDFWLCPRYGTFGAALATDTASAAAMGFVIQRLRHKGLWPCPILIPSSRDFAPFATYAGPLFLNNLLKMVAIVTLGTFATKIGFVQGAAHQICVSVFMLCGLALGMPLSWAARAFLPGGMEKAEYRRTARVLFAATLTAAFIGMSLSIAFLGRGLELFTQDPLVKAEVEVSAAPYVIPTVFCCVYYQSMEGILITQNRLQSLVCLSALLTILFGLLSSVLSSLGLLSLLVLWKTLSALVFVQCVAITIVAIKGLKTYESK